MFASPLSLFVTPCASFTSLLLLFVVPAARVARIAYACCCTLVGLRGRYRSCATALYPPPVVSAARVFPCGARPLFPVVRPSGDRTLPLTLSQDLGESQDSRAHPRALLSRDRRALLGLFWREPASSCEHVVTYGHTHGHFDRSARFSPLIRQPLRVCCGWCVVVLRCMMHQNAWVFTQDAVWPCPQKTLIGFQGNCMAANQCLLWAVHGHSEMVWMSKGKLARATTKGMVGQIWPTGHVLNMCAVQI